MRTVQEFRRDTDPAIVRAYGAIRRFVISLTDAAIWQLAGLMLPDGQEVFRSEVFGGIGIAARPPSSVQAEAICAMVGDANTPVVVAIRDEATRAASAGDLQPDETALYNSKSRVHVKADGTLEIVAIDGVANPLPTLADLQAVVSAVNALIAAYFIHIHTGGTISGDTGAPTVATAANAPSPTGTTVLRGQ